MVTPKAATSEKSIVGWRIIHSFAAEKQQKHWIMEIVSIEKRTFEAMVAKFDMGEPKFQN